MRTKINHGIKKLTFPNALAFSLSCCERLFPDYVGFCQITNCDSPHSLKKVLDELWQNIHQENILNKELEQQKNLCFRLAKNTGEHDHWSRVLAQNALSAIYTSLEYCITKDEKFSISVSEIVFDSLQQYLYIVNTPNFYPEIDDGLYEKPIFPLNFAEIKKQQEDISYLKNKQGFTEEELINFRKQSRGGILPVERGLI